MDARARVNPFPGLRPFGEEETHLFFGREGQSNAMIARLAQRRFLGVIGTSGSGKSSLVRAGLLPALQGGYMAQAGSFWRIALMRPGSTPIANLAAALADPEVLGDAKVAAPVRRALLEASLRRSSLGLAEVFVQARLDPHENLLVVVDQFEELFRFRRVATAAGTRDEAAAFVKLLLEAVAQAGLRIYVVIAMRSDFLGDCAEFRDLPEALNDGQYLIPRMARDERRQAIEGPIAVSGARIAPRLVQRLLNEVGDDPDQLPILQHALMRTWDAWRARGRVDEPIDFADYESIGTMANALSQDADEAFRALDGTGQAVAKRLFQLLCERGTDYRETRRPTILREIREVAATDAATVTRVIDAFRTRGRSFLLPSEGVALDDAAVVDISHEALIRLWKRLRGWVEEEWNARTQYLRVAEAAALHEEGRGSLWRDPELELALNWRVSQQPNAAWANRYEPGFERAMRFLDESVRERDRQRRRARQAFWAFVGLCVLVVGAAAHIGTTQYRHAQELAVANMGLEAAREKAEKAAADAKKSEDAARDAEDLAKKEKEKSDRLWLDAIAAGKAADAARGRAESTAKALARARADDASRQLAAKASDQELPTELRLLLAIEADKVAGTDEARRARLAAVDGRRTPKWRLSHDRLSTSAADPKGERIVTGAGDGTVKSWRFTGDAWVEEASVQAKGRIAAVAFSPAGTEFAVADNEGFRTWSVGSGGLAPAGEVKTPRRPTGVAFGGAGRTLIGALEDGSLAVASVDGTTVHPVPRWGPPGASRATRVAASPKRAVAVSAGRPPLIWDFETATATQGTATMPALQAIGGTAELVGAASGRDVTVLELPGGGTLGAPIMAPRGEIGALAIGNHSRRLAAGGVAGDLLLWRWDERGAVEPVTGLHRGRRIRLLTFSPDDARLAVADERGVVTLWNTRDATRVGPEYVRMDEDDTELDGLAFARSGTFLAGRAGETVSIWEIADRRQRASAPFTGVSRIRPDPEGGYSALTTAGWTRFDLRDGRLVSRRLDQAATPADRREVQSPSRKLTASINGKEVVVKSDHPDMKFESEEVVRGIAFSPDERTLAGVDGRDLVMLWSVARREGASEKRGDDAKAGGKLRSGGEKRGDDAEAGGKPRSGEQSGSPAARRTFRAFKSGLRSVAFSPDGTMLAVGAGDGTILLLDVRTGDRMSEPLWGHDTEVVALGFDATGSLLHSADWREVATWAIERKAGGTGSTAERSCELAGRNMKLDEWRRYFGDQPYRRTCPFPVAEEVIGGLDEDGVRAALRGDRAAAGAIFRNAADLARDVAESDDSVLNDLCWHGSVAGFASTVLNACELAVRYSNGSTGHRDSRGLARALTGNRRGAIEDFEAFVADRNHSEERRRERVQWIADLKAGRNPFDKATLERIRDQ